MLLILNAPKCIKSNEINTANNIFFVPCIQCKQKYTTDYKLHSNLFNAYEFFILYRNNGKIHDEESMNIENKCFCSWEKSKK